MNSKISILKSEILRDKSKLDRLTEKFTVAYKRFQKEKEYAFLVESAFYVNRLYTGFERMFKIIASAFENTIDQTSWHRSLLDRMVLDIEDIRPAVLSEDSHRQLNELRAFRHFFRHTYELDLDAEKFSIVASSTHKLKDYFEIDIQHFLEFLDKLLKK
jgi:HepT-like protein